MATADASVRSRPQGEAYLWEASQDAAIPSMGWGSLRGKLTGCLSGHAAKVTNALF